MKTYTIKPLPLVKIELDMGVFTYRMNYGKKVWAPVYTWYLTNGDEHILVDTGVQHDFVRAYRKVPAVDVASFESSLASVGLRPNEIRMIIQTHLHYDHCGNTSKCKRAKVVVQEDELKFALSPHPIIANLYHRPFLESVDFVTIRGGCEIVPGIEVVPVPGHSPGAQAVVVATDQGNAVISGFCCMRENFEPPLEVREAFPVLAPGIHTNAMDAFDSVQRVKGLADILIPQHDQCFLDIERLP